MAVHQILTSHSLSAAQDDRLQTTAPKWLIRILTPPNTILHHDDIIVLVNEIPGYSVARRVADELISAPIETQYVVAMVNRSHTHLSSRESHFRVLMIRERSQLGEDDL